MYRTPGMPLTLWHARRLPSGFQTLTAYTAPQSEVAVSVNLRVLAALIRAPEAGNHHLQHDSQVSLHLQRDDHTCSSQSTVAPVKERDQFLSKVSGPTQLASSWQRSENRVDSTSGMQT
jgi:hypothetical protein